MGLSLWSRGRKTVTPGPGRYDIPDQFGDGPKFTLKGRMKQKEPDPEPPIRSMSSTLNKKGSSFGYSAYVPKPYVTPAPNYTPPKFGSDGRKTSFRFRREEKPNENPGPADYTINRDLKTTAIAIGEGKRYDLVDPNSYSSPCDHPEPRVCPEERPATIGKFIPRPQPKRYGPGPAKYNMEIDLIKSNTPIYIGEGRRGERPSTNPGPADYTINRDLMNPEAVPINLKGRPPLPHGDICDYPYNKLPDTIQPKKVSMGIRPKTSYETPGPGPEYKAESTLSRQGYRIGNRTPLYDGTKGIPGPGTYFKMPPSERAGPFEGFSGPSDRSLINEREAVRTPGPADYRFNRDLDKFERGFYFTSRKMEDFVPDTDAPFHDIPSTLGGPKFTIGNKEQDW